MRYEDLVNQKVTVVFGGGVQKVTGTVTGGDGDSIFLEEEDGTRIRMTKGQIVYIKEEKA